MSVGLVPGEPLSPVSRVDKCETGHGSTTRKPPTCKLITSTSCRSNSLKDEVPTTPIVEGTRGKLGKVWICMCDRATP